jgi:hypothetical protein
LWKKGFLQGTGKAGKGTRKERRKEGRIVVAAVVVCGVSDGITGEEIVTTNVC